MPSIPDRIHLHATTLKLFQILFELIWKLAAPPLIFYGRHRVVDRHQTFSSLLLHMVRFFHGSLRKQQRTLFTKLLFIFVKFALIDPAQPLHPKLVFSASTSDVQRQPLEVALRRDGDLGTFNSQLSELLANVTQKTAPTHRASC